VLGQAIDPSASSISYYLPAHISGLNVQGTASFTITTTAGDGSSTIVKGSALLGGMIPAETFPLGCTYGVDCTSGIPGIFLGMASVTVQACPPQSSSGGHGSGFGWGGFGHKSTGCTDVSHLTLPMQFESAFLNPFGGPIFMASEGGEIFVVSTYAESRVTWAGIQLGGTASGSLAGSPVSGGFGMTVYAVEDLVAGTEYEVGSISLVGMNPSTLNAAGHFLGKSTIPPGVACPDSLGFPPGTCQLTGFSSAGAFSMLTQSKGTIMGTYSTTWTVPAVAFTSSVSASFMPSGGH